MLEFNDSIKINTKGPLRSIHLSDGWYVTGKGILVPVKDREEANTIIAEMKDE